MKREYVIDGVKFSTLEEFKDAIDEVLLPQTNWGRNLDAFNDILRGGFGTPEEGFVIRWKNSEVSRERLGYAETIRQLESCLTTCHPSNIESVRDQLNAAIDQTGPTVFDWLVEIIQIHCPGGEEEEDGVELILE